MRKFHEEIEISRLTRVEKYLPTRMLRETEIDYYWQILQSTSEQESYYLHYI